MVACNSSPYSGRQRQEHHPEFEDNLLSMDRLNYSSRTWLKKPPNPRKTLKYKICSIPQVPHILQEETSVCWSFELLHYVNKGTRRLTLIIPTGYLRQKTPNKSKHYHIANTTGFIRWVCILELSGSNILQHNYIHGLYSLVNFLIGRELQRNALLLVYCQSRCSFTFISSVPLNYSF